MKPDTEPDTMADPHFRDRRERGRERDAETRGWLARAIRALGDRP